MTFLPIARSEDLEEGKGRVHELADVEGCGVGCRVGAGGDRGGPAGACFCVEEEDGGLDDPAPGLEGPDAEGLGRLTRGLEEQRVEDVRVQ